MTEKKVPEQEKKAVASRYCITDKLRKVGAPCGKPIFISLFKSRQPPLPGRKRVRGEREVVWHCEVHVYARTHRSKGHWGGDSSLKRAI